MTPLDPSGDRANSPGFTPEAKKAASAAKWKARRQAAFAWIRAHLPAVLVLACAGAVLIAATVFDWFMSSRGWMDILPGLGWFAYAGALGSVGFWYLGCWQFRAQLRAKDMSEAIIWAVIAGVAYLICITGVTVATLTNTSEAKRMAENSRIEKTQLEAQRDGLKSELGIYSPDYFKFAIARDTRTLNAQLAIGKGTWGMPDLDIDGACAQKLSFNQRRICAVVNGGVDEFTGKVVPGLRSDIEQSQNGLKEAEAKTAELSALNDRIQHFTVETGDKTARALGFFLASESAGNIALMVVIVFLSAAFLLCGGLFGEWVIRRLMGK